MTTDDVAPPPSPEDATFGDLRALSRDEALTPATLLARKRSALGLAPPTAEDVAMFEANIERDRKRLEHTARMIGSSPVVQAMSTLRASVGQMTATREKLGSLGALYTRPPTTAPTVRMPPSPDARSAVRLGELLELQQQNHEVQLQIVEVLQRMHEANEAAGAAQAAVNKRFLRWTQIAGVSAVLAILVGLVAPFLGH